MVHVIHVTHVTLYDAVLSELEAISNRRQGVDLVGCSHDACDPM
jgi:hypothetical protein